MAGIESLYLYFNRCELLEGRELHTDTLPAGQRGYVIRIEPEIETVRRYVDSSSIKRCKIMISSQNEYDAETMENLFQCGFFGKIEQWMQAQNLLKEFPALGDKQTAIKWEVQQRSLLTSEETKQARYQIECILEYFEEV